MTFKSVGPVKVSYCGIEIGECKIVKIETTPDPEWLTELIQNVVDHLPADFTENRLGLARKLVSAELLFEVGLRQWDRKWNRRLLNQSSDEVQ